VLNLSASRSTTCVGARTRALALSLTILPRRLLVAPAQVASALQPPIARPTGCLPRSCRLAGKGVSCGCPARSNQALVLVLGVQSRPTSSRSPNTQSGRDVSELIPWLISQLRQRHENVRSFHQPRPAQDVNSRQRFSLPLAHDLH